MKVLFLAPEIFTNNGGIPRILRLYLKALCDLAAERSQEVRLVALNDEVIGSSELRRYSNDKLESWEVCSGNKLRFIRAGYMHGKATHHVVCGHVAQLPVALLLKLHNKNLTYDVVAHGIDVWRPFNVAEKLALRFARRILCISAFTRDKMAEFFPLCHKKAVLLPNGLDAYFPIAETVLPPSQPPTILSVARLTQDDIYKGIDSLIQAMPKVREQIPNVKLRIIGQGDDMLRLRRLISRLKLDACVEMPGFVPDEQLQESLRSCSLFAMPSKKEGFGLVFIEAMAQGRPCLGARAGGIPEVLTPETGVLVEFGDIQGIAEACVQALGRTWDTEFILERARHFSYPRFKERLGALLPGPPP